MILFQKRTSVLAVHKVISTSFSVFGNKTRDDHEANAFYTRHASFGWFLSNIHRQGYPTTSSSLCATYPCTTTALCQLVRSLLFYSSHHISVSNPLHSATCSNRISELEGLHIDDSCLSALLATIDPLPPRKPYCNMFEQAAILTPSVWLVIVGSLANLPIMQYVYPSSYFVSSDCIVVAHGCQASPDV